MKTVILCGGRGTRLDELGRAVPKALVPIGGEPVIWHLLNIFTHQGFDEFVLCLGYLKEKIRHYFAQIADKVDGDSYVIDREGVSCRVVLADTGIDTNTGGRIKSVEKLLPKRQAFFVTYGDGLADVDLVALREFHREHGKIATLTAVHPVSNFGILDIDPNAAVIEFKEKPNLDNWINGGFFVFKREIFDLLDHGSVLEQEPLSSLAGRGELMAFRHAGFWKCMDTYKDSVEMNHLWQTDAPWKTW